MIKKEDVQKRLDSLKEQREKVVAQANAIAGAIQTLESLLTDVDKEDTNEQSS